MNSDKDNWQGTDWDAAELNTLRAGAALTFREKLEWLEEAGRLGRHLLTCKVRYPDPKNAGGWILADRAPYPEPSAGDAALNDASPAEKKT